MSAIRTYREGYRLTVTEDGLLIEVIDYHARPLFLDEEALEQIGIALQADR